MVGFLCLFYILSYIDRVILSLLAQPLRDELGVDDLQLGLLFGTAFAIFYGLVGMPIARIADTRNRKWLVLAGVTMWSLSTMFSAFASTFALLVIFRIGLAIGEAALSPSAYSMIADSFAPEKRALPASLYAASGTFGAYGAYMIGAAVISAIEAPRVAEWVASYGLSPWRIVFIVVGVPGLVLALLFWMLVREPRRDGATSASPAKPPALPLRDFLKQLGARWKFYLGLVGGAGGVNIISFAYAGWTPEILRRDFSFTISEAGLWFGLVGLCASIPGTLGLAWVSDRLRAAGRKDALVFTAAVAAAAGGAFAAAAPLAQTAPLFLGLLFFAVMLLTGCTNLAFVSSQSLAPPGGRAMFVSLMLLGTTMIGLGIGPPLAAFLANSVFAGQFQPALVTISLIVAVTATSLLINGLKDSAKLADESCQVN